MDSSSLKNIIKQPGGSSRSRVLNKAPAQVQITAEQLLRDAFENREVVSYKGPKQQISDLQELQEYRHTRRKEFEDRLRMNRTNVSLWARYAKWEVAQREFERARSIFERALEIDPRNNSLYLQYAEMEMKNRFINHARNIWDRAVSLLPRVDQFWYKYSYMEEMLGNIDAAREIFMRWMKWNPQENGWAAFIRFEMRRGNVENARRIWERYLAAYPIPQTFIKYAKFEEHQRNHENARAIYERAAEELPEMFLDAEFYLAFAKFEERVQELDRARAIYKFALDQIKDEDQKEKLYESYAAFEKQRGDREGVEMVLLSKRRLEYEAKIKENPKDYDVWFDYTRMEQSAGDIDKTREVYERAIAHVPPLDSKRYWRRYVYLWINYAVWEELENSNLDRASDVYAAFLSIVPNKHKSFTFSKIWTLAANLEIRRGNLSRARKIYGQALGLCPKEKIFRNYLEMELALGEIDRCRTIYKKWLEHDPLNEIPYLEFAQFEASLGEQERARMIYDIGTMQMEVENPEVLWKASIDFEIDEGNYDRVRKLYGELLEKTNHHVRVWISFAKFEEIYGDGNKAREIYGRGERHVREVLNEMAGSLEGEAEALDLRRDGYELMQNWKAFEQGPLGDESILTSLEGRMPRKVKKKRAVINEQGQPGGFEEYYDYIYHEEGKPKPQLRILEIAHQWKKQKMAEES